MRPRILALILVMAVLLPCVSCSKNLGPETLPPSTVPTTSETTEVTETTKPTETTEETEPPETEPTEPEPTSGPRVTKKPVSTYGQLTVSGNMLTNKDNKPVMLRGISSAPLNVCTGFFATETVKTLAEDWGIDVLRIAVPANSGANSYISNPDKYFKQVTDLIDMCIDQGIYVIVAWHHTTDGNPAKYQKQAIAFFTRIAGIYADSPNVMYEVCHEPNGTRVVKKKKVAIDWGTGVKPYAEAVIKAIRAIDKDNIIIVGTPNWSHDVERAATNPIKNVNICYSVHFNAGSDGEALRKKITTAKNKGLCVIATEWKTTDSHAKNAPDAKKCADWLNFIEKNNISWCNCSIGANSVSHTNALLFGSETYSIEDIFVGHWPDGLISPSGLIVRNRILSAKGVKISK